MIGSLARGVSMFAITSAIALPAIAATRLPKTTLGFVHVWPPPLFPAPTTTHVWIEAERTFVAAGAIAIAPAGARADARVVTTARSTTGTGDLVTLEIAPRAPLTPSTRYDVSWIDAEGGAHLLSTFVTSGDVDRSPPAWTGAVTWAFVDPNAKPPGAILLDRPSVPTVIFSFASAFDAPCPPADAACRFGDAATPVMFGVWVEDARGVIAYDEPAAAYLVQPPEVVRTRRAGRGPTTTGWLGDEMLGLTNYVPPRDRRSIRVGIAAVDLSGNVGDAREIEIEIELSK